MYTDNNGQTYKLDTNTAIIQQNVISTKIEIFPTITYKNKIYEVVFPDNCSRLFENDFLKEFTLHKLLHPTTNITNMKKMFYGCNYLKSLDLSNLDTSNVTNMKFMFNSCDSLKELNLHSFNTQNVTNMIGMFCCLLLESLNISSFVTSKVTTMKDIFCNCKSLQSLDVSNFDTSNVTDMEGMFYNCKTLKSLDVSSFDTSKATNFCCMFSYCSLLNTLDLSNFDTSKALNMFNMLEGCYSITTINLSNFKFFNPSIVEEMMFNNHLKQVTLTESFNNAILHIEYTYNKISNKNTIISDCKYDKKVIYDVNCNNSYK